MKRKQDTDYINRSEVEIDTLIKWAEVQKIKGATHISFYNINDVPHIVASFDREETPQERESRIKRERFLRRLGHR